MKKLLPVVFCGLAAISYSAFAADSSVKTDANTSNPQVSNSKESSTELSANPNASAQDADKPAKRDVNKPKRAKKSTDDASSGASAAPGTSGTIAPTPGAASSDPAAHGASGGAAK
jgi:hypothetical protein